MLAETSAAASCCMAQLEVGDLQLHALIADPGNTFTPVGSPLRRGEIEVTAASRFLAQQPFGQLQLLDDHDLDRY